MYTIDIFPENATMSAIHDIVNWLNENIGIGCSSLVSDADFKNHKWNAVGFNKNKERSYSYINKPFNEQQISIFAITFQIRDKADYLTVKLRWK